MNAFSSLFRRKRPIAFLGATFVIALVAIGSTLGIANAAGSKAAVASPQGNQSAACAGYKAFKEYLFYINGKPLPVTWSKNDILNKPKQGDTVTLHFVLKPECDNMYVGLDSYTTAPPPNQLNYSQQKLFRRDAKIFSYNNGATQRVQVELPECYFQVDAYTQSIFTPGDHAGSGGPGFLTGDIGGSDADCAGTTTVPATVPTTAPIDKVNVTAVCAAESFKVTSLLTAGFTYVWHVNGVEYAKQAATTTGNVDKTFKFADVNVAFGKDAVVKVINVEKAETIGTETITNNCTPPVANAATATKVCEGEDGFKVTITNNATSQRDFVTWVEGKEVATNKLGAGSTVNRTYPFKDFNVAYGKTANITVFEAGKEAPVMNTVITNDCTVPGTVPNTTSTTSSTSTSTTVAPTTTTTSTTVVPNTTSTTSTTSTTVAPRVLPAANVTLACPEENGNAVFTFTNNGDVDQTFTVTRDGKLLPFDDGKTTLVVAAQKSAEKILVLAEDESATVTVRSEPGNFSFTRTVLKDCADVEGVVVTTTTTQAPQVLGVTLARTGLGVVPMSGLGMLLLGLGAAVLNGRKRLK